MCTIALQRYNETTTATTCISTNAYWKWGQMPYTYRGCPYYKNESTTQVMPQEMYEERLRAAKPEKFAWERQEAEGLALADLDEKRIRGAVRLGVERGRMPATAREV